ncbi:hypothetical protein DRP04_08895 [Archaeoglobales archaeon]|nr:MAG: hypothetical protein DRP04_08895 [Archaeoglobales archaeon]
MLRNPWKEKAVHKILSFCEHGMTERLVSQFLDEFKKEENNVLLDPFVGSGTVLVEALKTCELCIGIDTNPWALIVTKSKTERPHIDEKDFIELFENIKEFEPYIPSERLFKYHTESQLIMLGKIRALIEELNDKKLALTVFASIAEKFSKIKKSPAPKFRKKIRNQSMDIPEEFKRKFLESLNEVKKYNETTVGETSLILADSSRWLPKSFDGILTSPPFANNIDYVRHTQLHLLWAGLANDSKELGKLRSLQIPACEASARSWKEKTEKNWIITRVSKINSKRKYSNFLLQYFHSMEKHFELVAEALTWEAWYTIGDSYFAGEYIPTHEFLRRLAEEVGLEAETKQIGYRAGGRRIYLLKLKPKN